jgi:hypothetical protein
MVDLARGWSRRNHSSRKAGFNPPRFPCFREKYHKTAVFGSFEARNSTSKRLKELHFMANSAT